MDKGYVLQQVLYHPLVSVHSFARMHPICTYLVMPVDACISTCVCVWVLSAYRYIIASLPQMNVLIFMYIICIREKLYSILKFLCLHFKFPDSDVTIIQVLRFIFGEQTSGIEWDRTHTLTSPVGCSTQALGSKVVGRKGIQVLVLGAHFLK